MKLNLVDRERISDSVLKIQSVRASLDKMDDEKIPRLEEMNECLKGVDHGLREALGYARGAELADSPSFSPRQEKKKRD
jgi:hypothetical protein